MGQRWYCGAIAVGFLVAALTRVQCQTSKPQCVERIVYCDRGKVLNDCNITRYRHYVKMFSNQMLNNSLNRFPTEVLKGNRHGLTGDCYIEVILGKDDNILFVRFGSRRVLLTGKIVDPDWTKFETAVKMYEDKPDGMQMLIDLNFAQICPQLSIRAGINKKLKTSKVLARFTERASILNGPFERYTVGEFGFIEFESYRDDLLQMQAVTHTPNSAVNLKQFLNNSLSQPLTIWVYKCPAAMRIMDRPCNSEVNVYLYLRQWLNSSGLNFQDDDFFSKADWRMATMYKDIPLIILMTVFSVYIAVHLTLVSWFGLANASAKAGI